MITNYTRQYGRSPTYKYNNVQLTTTSTQLFSFEDLTPTAKKYVPFNFLKITNTSSYDIEAYINQDTADVLYIPAGTIISLTSNDLPALRSLIIKNISASTINADLIRVEVRKNDVGSDEFANIKFKEKLTFEFKKELI